MAAPNSNAGVVNGNTNGGHVPVGSRNAQTGDNEYDRHSMLGNLMENYDADDDVPLLYFHSIPEAWVRSLCSCSCRSVSSWYDCLCICSWTGL